MEQKGTQFILERKFDVKLIVLLASRGVKLMFIYLEERNTIF